MGKRTIMSFDVIGGVDEVNERERIGDHNERVGGDKLAIFI